MGTFSFADDQQDIKLFKFFCLEKLKYIIQNKWEFKRMLDLDEVNTVKYWHLRWVENKVLTNTID